MVSSVGTGSTAGHGSTSKIVIAFQSLIILSLSYWLVEEYLNNKYLGEYLNGVFQTDGLVIGMLGTLLVLGSFSSLVFLKRRHGEKKFGAVSLEVASSTPKIKLAAEPATKASEAFSKPSADFHPVVAALKADMADRRMSFGSVASSGNVQSEMPSAPPIGTQKGSVLDQFPASRQPINTGSTPSQIGASSPQRSSPDSRPQGQIGQMQQSGALVAQRPMPLLRAQQPTGSNVLQPSQTPPPPHIPSNVTTVITGIMPAQKKKDPTDPSEEKPSSSQ